MNFDKSKKVFPIITGIIGLLIFAAIFILRLNLVTVVAVAYMCIISALILLGLIIKKKLYLWNLIGYGASGLGIILYYIIFGADAGFGAFTTGLAGFKSVDYTLFTRWAEAPIRIIGNIFLAFNGRG